MIGREHVQHTVKMTKKDIVNSEIVETFYRNDNKMNELRDSLIERDDSIRQRIAQAREEFDKEEEDLEAIFNRQMTAQARKEEEEEEDAIARSLESVIEENLRNITSKGDASKIKGKSKVRQHVEQQGQSNDRKYEEEQCLPESPIDNQTTETMSIPKKKIKNEQQEQQGQSKTIYQPMDSFTENFNYSTISQLPHNPIN